MSISHNASAPSITPVHVGEAVVGRTTYKVFTLGELSENARAAGVNARFMLEGPRGSQYYVTDYGPKYLINSVCLGGGVTWRAQPRPLRGLTREHLSLFIEAQVAQQGGRQ